MVGDRLLGQRKSTSSYLWKGLVDELKQLANAFRWGESGERFGIKPAMENSLPVQRTMLYMALRMLVHLVYGRKCGTLEVLLDSPCCYGLL